MLMRQCSKTGKAMGQVRGQSKSVGVSRKGSGGFLSQGELGLFHPPVFTGINIWVSDSFLGWTNQQCQQGANAT